MDISLKGWFSRVKENVVNILLNFKKLRFTFDEKSEPIQWISQRFKGL